ncbi:MAG: sugar ABC transporter permease [Clostridia bacterium]
MKKIGGWADRNLKYLFTVPTIIFVLCMVLFPIIYTTILSFHSWRMSVNIPWEYVGMRNYIEMFSSSRFPMAALRTFIFAGVSLLVEVVLGLIIALALNRNFRCKNLTKTAFLLPMVATPVAIGMVWKLIYEPTIGILNYFIRYVLGGPKIDWLGSTTNALYSLIVVDIWQWTPMVMLIVLAGLSAISTECYESAMVDGATPFQTTTKITLPLLKPTIFTAVLLRLIDVLKTFDIIYSMTQGGPGFATETINILSYRQAFEFLEFGQASATLVVFFIIVMVIAALTIKAKSKAEVDIW